MEAQDQIVKFKEYFEDYMLDLLLERVGSGCNSITLDFMELSKFSLDLSNNLLENPVETLKAAEIAVEQIDLPKQVKDFRVWLENPPSDTFKKVSHIRHIHFGKLCQVEGVIRGKTKVMPHAVSARFECPSCGNILPVLQQEHKFRQPTRCGCGRKGKFKLLSKELRDFQRLELEELPENVFGNAQPQKLKILLCDDLTDPDFEKRFNPGCRVRINGIMTELPIQTRSGAMSTDFDFILNSVHLEPIEEEEFETFASPGERMEFEALARSSDCMTKLVENLIPSIHGHEKIKEALLLQAIGGTRKINPDGTSKRGDIHILLIGDPGAGKSQILTRMKKVIPTSQQATGESSSGVGLTAAAIKDEFLGGWTVQAGIIVLAHKSLAIIDEFDKMSPDDRKSMHSAMEGQTVRITKAGINAELTCQTSILAAANPKFGRFDPYTKTLAEQIDLPPTIINRFDLIFPIRDIPDREKDRYLAQHIGRDHQGKNENYIELDTNFIRKYLFHAKTIKPTISNAALDEIVKYYTDIRNKAQSNQGIKAVPISARQMETLIRLSEAYAKLRLSKEVEREDAERAISILEHYLRQVAFDKETGGFDIDRVSVGTSASDRNHIKIIRDIINALEPDFKNTIPLENIVQRASLQGLNEEQTKKALNRLKQTKDIFEPRSGKFTKL